MYNKTFPKYLFLFKMLQFKMLRKKIYKIWWMCLSLSVTQSITQLCNSEKPPPLIMCGWTEVVEQYRWGKFYPFVLICFGGHFNTKYSWDPNTGRVFINGGYSKFLILINVGESRGAFDPLVRGFQEWKCTIISTFSKKSTSTTP